MAPAVLQSPVHVYAPSVRAGLANLFRAASPLALVTQYGDEHATRARPVAVVFYGQHYDALLLPTPAPAASDSDASSDASIEL